MGYIRWENGMNVLVLESGGIVQVTSDANINIENGGELRVFSGGTLAISTGATLDVDSGGTIDVGIDGSVTIADKADITVALGGSVNFPVNGATSSGFNGSSSLSTQSAADGITFINSSGSNYKITLAAPYPGAQKTIYNTAGTTGMVQYISVGSGIGIVTTGGDSTAHMMVNEGTTVGAQAGWCHLTGLSTSRWIRTNFSPSSQWVIVSTSS